MLNFKKVLIIAAHPDDGELGMGGTIIRMLQNRIDILYLVLSFCEDSVPNNFPRRILYTEMDIALEHLGMNVEEQRAGLFYDVRRFNEKRQNILQHLYDIGKTYKPDAVFYHASTCQHQDHRVVASEAPRAFRDCWNIQYESPGDNMYFQPNFFVKLEEEHIIKKLVAIEAYKSQRHRRMMNPAYLRALATMRGTQAGCQYTEAFRIERGMI